MHDEDMEALGALVWRMRDGREILWRDMSPQHLRNCAAMLERNMAEEIYGAYSAYSSVQGEAAEYAMESAIHQLEDDEHPTRVYANEMKQYAEWREHR